MREHVHPSNGKLEAPGVGKEGEGVDSAAGALLDSADGAFNFGNVFVGGADVEGNVQGVKAIPKGLKFVVTVYDGDREIAGSIEVANAGDAWKDVRTQPSRDGLNGDKTKIAGDSCKKDKFVDIEDVNAEGHLLMGL